MEDTLRPWRTPVIVEMSSGQPTSRAMSRAQPNCATGPGLAGQPLAPPPRGMLPTATGRQTVLSV